ncbi:MAG TPA: hypothetical protein VNQ77_11025 [Frankiaceae bacterium]|nr:hypothetical protein [Frankiaceae bacterium]
MRKHLAVAVLGLGLAASFAPLSPASAVCTNQIQDVVDTCRTHCAPVDVVNRHVLIPRGQHIDCW